MGLQRVGLVHSGTTAGWAGAQWDYSGLGWCIMGLQRVGLVNNGTTAGWCTVGLQRGWAGAKGVQRVGWCIRDYSGLGWCIMGLQRVGLVHNGTTAGWAGA